MAVINPGGASARRAAAFWGLGFRPFFLAAGAWAVVSVAVWLLVYVGGVALPLAGLAPAQWHAHEMVFGYAAAVIAGFLLTAARNWTGRRTADGAALMALLALWLGARLLGLFAGSAALGLLVGLNAVFLLGLIVAVARPVILARQWHQAVVLAPPLALLAAQWLVWALPQPRAGVFLGLFMVLLLIFVMGRRVIPFFIERGVSPPVQLPQSLALDVACIVLYLAYAAAEMLAPVSAWTAVAAALAALVHGVRLILWHAAGLWQRPLLWVLWVGYAWIVLGLALRAAGAVWPVSPFLSLHALTYGGIGMITLGMMARVALGHSGLDVQRPPPVLGLLFAALALGTAVRVLLPLLAPSYYALSVIVAQLLWVGAFAGFVAVYAPILLRTR